MNLGRWKWWYSGGWEEIHCPLSFPDPCFSPFPLPVDSSDLLLGMVHDCGTPDGGAVHNSSEDAIDGGKWLPGPLFPRCTKSGWGGRECEGLPRTAILEEERGVSFPYVISVPEVSSLKPKVVSHPWPERGHARPFSVFLLPSFSRFPFPLLYNPPLPSLSSLWVCSPFFLHSHPFSISIFLFPSSCPPYFLSLISLFCIPILLSSSPYCPLQLSVLSGAHS